MRVRSAVCEILLACGDKASPEFAVRTLELVAELGNVRVCSSLLGQGLP